MRPAISRTHALPPARGGGWRCIEVALVVATSAWLAVRAFHVIRAGWAYTADDAYITLRYARNVADGNGIVWNVGDAIPAEGYSNFLFVLLGAASLRLGVDPMEMLKELSVASLVPTCFCLYVLARRWLRPLAATLPALFLVAFDGELFWALSGLETALFQCFTVAATTAFVVGMGAPLDGPADPTVRWAWRRSRYPLHLIAAAFCLLASLTRPEGPLVAVVLGATALVEAAVGWVGARSAGRERERARKEVLRALMMTVRAFTLGFAAPYALYFAWRAVHFRRLVPNTVACKSHLKEYEDQPPWGVVSDFWKGYAPADKPGFFVRPTTTRAGAKVLVALALLQAPRRLGTRGLPLFLLLFAYVVALYGADGIIAHHSRHFLAAVALLVVASSLGLANLAALAAWPMRWRARLATSGPPTVGDDSRRRRGSPWPLLLDAALVALCVKWLAPHLADLEQYAAKSAEDYGRGRMAQRAELGRYLEKTLSPEQSFLIGDAGLVPYLTHARAIDAYCLNSREWTALPVLYNKQRFVDWVYDSPPDVLVVPSSSKSVLAPHAYYGVFPLLVGDRRFKDRYRQARVRPFGAAGDDFAYWVFERKPGRLP